MAQTLILYHKGCADGFCAAWIAWRRYGTEAEYVPVQYGDTPPDVVGKHVYILDFSFKRAILEEMHATAAKLVVLDHHKTAQEELRGLPYCAFDMTRSGGRMTWNYFAPGVTAPWQVDYTEDRDLWLWKLDKSREVSAALQSYPFDFDLWMGLDLEKMKTEGAAIERYKSQLVQVHKNAATMVRIAGYTVPCVNATCVVSELGNELCADAPFSASWFWNNQTREYVVSLRSRRDGVDVSGIAKIMGGGGHREAAGYSTSCMPAAVVDPNTEA